MSRKSKINIFNKIIENLYQIYGAGLHKIWFDLKNNITLKSYVSIEDILFNSDLEFNHIGLF